MPIFGPIRRSELVAALRCLGFDGPYSGGKHQYMIRGSKRLTIPNPHHGDIGRDLLSQMLKQAGISKEEWGNA